jgi:FtsZ-binding cell division protein ZapB
MGGGAEMNKRLMQFLNDLAEENDRLEKEVERTRLHIGVLIETNQELRKTVSEWKAKVRKLKKEAQ